MTACPHCLPPCTYTLHTPHPEPSAKLHLHHRLVRVAVSHDGVSTRKALHHEVERVKARDLVGLLCQLAAVAQNGLAVTLKLACGMCVLGGGRGGRGVGVGDSNLIGLLCQLAAAAQNGPAEARAISPGQCAGPKVRRCGKDAGNWESGYA
eukprot:58221-Chlamydomonas_euryale.AAC.1